MDSPICHHCGCRSIWKQLVHRTGASIRAWCTGCSRDADPGHIWYRRAAFTDSERAQLDSAAQAARDHADRQLELFMPTADA